MLTQDILNRQALQSRDLFLQRRWWSNIANNDVSGLGAEKACQGNALASQADDHHPPACKILSIHKTIVCSAWRKISSM
jgi:hypothetical protein